MRIEATLFSQDLVSVVIGLDDKSGKRITCDHLGNVSTDKVALPVVLDAPEGSTTAGIEDIKAWRDVVKDVPELQGRIPVKPRPPKNLWQKATDFSKAGASRIAQGAVSLPVLNHRRSVCLGVDENGEQVSKPCPSVKDHEGHQYCKTCGCPEWKLARLDGEKLKFPALACPKGKWSAMPGAMSGNR